jgi:hypothetical protein
VVTALRVLISAIAMAAPAAAAADLSKQARQAAVSVTHRLDLQTELPRDPESAPWHLDLPLEVWQIALICGLAVLAYLSWPYLRQLRLPLWLGGRERPWQAESTDLPGDTATPQAEAVASADELAESGYFVEAMHRLLLQGLADIREHSGEHFADSMTSREILRQARLPDSGRSALREIISGVETTYFGDYPARYADYEACRRQFIELSQSWAVS